MSIKYNQPIRLNKKQATINNQYFTDLSIYTVKKKVTEAWQGDIIIDGNFYTISHFDGEKHIKNFLSEAEINENFYKL